MLIKERIVKQFEGFHPRSYSQKMDETLKKLDKYSMEVLT